MFVCAQTIFRVRARTAPGQRTSRARTRLLAPASWVYSRLRSAPCADAYAGQNTKIRDTLNNLILKSPQSWQTTAGLPFFQIQGTVVEWDEYTRPRSPTGPWPSFASLIVACVRRRRVRFDVRLMQRVPVSFSARPPVVVTRLSPLLLCDVHSTRASRGCRRAFAGATAIAWFVADSQ